MGIIGVMFFIPVALKDSLEESDCVRDGKASTPCWLISWQYKALLGNVLR